MKEVGVLEFVALNTDISSGLKKTLINIYCGEAGGKRATITTLKNIGYEVKASFIEMPTFIDNMAGGKYATSNIVVLTIGKLTQVAKFLNPIQEKIPFLVKKSFIFN